MTTPIFLPSDAANTYSPTFQHALAMVRIEKSYEEPEVVIDVRGKKLRAEVVKMPFYKRG